METTLADEVVSINSIYGEQTLEPAAEDLENVYILSLPHLPGVTLRLSFPADYPETCPSVLGTQSVGDGRRGRGEGQRIVETVRDVLAKVHRSGEPCVFDLIEESRIRLELAQGGQGDDGEIDKGIWPDDGRNENADVLGPQDSIAKEEASTVEPTPGPSWTLSDPITEKKSVFLARATTVTSTTEAASFLSHLLAHDKKAAKATHNIRAWRIRGVNGTTFQDCDDDGESAAGGRLLHLMQIMDAWDVMVVVTRWYGGKKLGPDRFRIINNVARDALSRMVGEKG